MVHQQETEVINVELSNITIEPDVSKVRTVVHSY